MQNIRKVDLTPGIQKDRSPLAAEPGWVDSQWIRFRGEKPESMGGYTAFTGSPDIGAAVTASHAWTDLSGNKWLAVGTSTALKVVSAAGAITDISPEFTSAGVWEQVTVYRTNGSTTFRAVAYQSITTGADADGAPILAYVGHGLTNGQSVYLGWVGSAKTVTVISDTVFTYQDTAAGSSGNTGYTNAYYSVGGGFGGASDGWCLDNFGENLVALVKGGALYQWAPNANTGELIADGDFDASTNWTTGSGWSITTGNPGYAAYTGSSTTAALEQRLTTPIVPGSVYRISFDVATASTAFSIRFRVASTTETTFTTVTPYASGATTYTTYTYFVTAPANPDSDPEFNTVKVMLASQDGSETYRIRNISIKRASTALQVSEAPAVSDAMFVDPNRFVVLLGTQGYDGVYNSLLVRWCDQEDIYDWTPAADNLSGEQPISTGVSLVGGIATRGQNVLLSESDAHLMQYTGDTATVFSITPLASNCGCVGNRAMAKDGSGNVYWWSNAGQFYRFAGGAPEPIPCTLVRDVMDNVTTSLYSKIHIGLHPPFNELFFFYPDTRDTATDVTRYAKFNFKEGVWDSGSFVCTAWIPQGVYSYSVAIDGDGDVFYMDASKNANGGSLTTSVTSSYFDIEDGGNLVLVQRIIPDFDDQQGDVLFNFNLKQYPNGSTTTKGPYTATTSTEKLDMIFTGRQAQVIVSSAAAPTFWRLGAMRFDIRKSGSRR